jgi:oligoribonuclease
MHARMCVQGPELAIHHSEEVLAAMNEWCIEHHGSSGLTERCRASTVSMAQAEAQARVWTENKS